MTRTISVVILATVLALTSSVVEAQWPYIPVPIGAYGFGGYGAFGAYGYGPYRGYGFSPYAGYGYAPCGGFGGVYGGYGSGPFNYGLYRQQAFQTRLIFRQQQQAIIGQIQDAQSRLEKLDTVEQQLLQKYLDMNDSDKAAVRANLMTDYLSLDAQEMNGWKQDAAVQAIIGEDLPRLDGVAQLRDMSESDQTRFRSEMLQKYRTLSFLEQQSWQKDQVVGIIMGKGWWLK